MLTMVHQFYAMASDCAVHLCGETAEYLGPVAAAAEAEVRRIETRYSRYRADSELSRINLVAACGGATDVDAETAGLIAYAKACFRSSRGAFDITSGLLRQASAEYRFRDYYAIARATNLGDEYVLTEEYHALGN